MLTNKKLTTLAVWGPYFKVSLYVMVTSFTTETTVILNFGIAEDEYVFKSALRITIKDNTLKILYPVSQTSHSFFDYTIEKNRWYQLEILQNQTNEKVSSE